MSAFISTLAAFAREIPGLRRDALLQRGLTLVMAEAPSRCAAILRCSDRVEVRAIVGDRAGVEMLQRSLPLMEGMSPIAMRDMELPTSARRALLRLLDQAESSTCLIRGLVVDGEGYGLLLLIRDADLVFTSGEREAVSTLADLLGLGLLKVRLAWRLWQQQQVLEQRDGEQLIAGGAGSRPLLERSRSPAMRNCVLLARQVASTTTPVLLGGETGVGKEVVARAIHSWSTRASKPFIAVNCAALPDTLVESELFGHAAGAFSGATGNRPGRFAAADGGTLLLDEIGELPLAAQATLLRVLQEGRFEPVGSDRTIAVDVRIIAATNRDLEREVAAGRFRADLWYRLSVFPIHLPPLRERRDDIPTMATEWLEQRAEASGRGPWTLSPAALERLRVHAWPGNVRELFNALERATILQPRGMLPVDYFPLTASAAPVAVASLPSTVTLAEQEAITIRAALTRCRGRIYGPLGAAAELGLPPSTLQSRMKRLGIPRITTGG